MQETVFVSEPTLDANALSVLRNITQKNLFTKMDVVRETQLSFPTVNAILGTLQSGGYIVPVGSARARNGRPPLQYRFEPSARYAIGVEIKIPQIIIGLVNLRGDPIAIVDYPFLDNATPEFVAETLQRGISDILKANSVRLEKLVGIGLGVPGFVQKDTGIWLGIPRVPRVKNIPLRTLLSERFGVAVTIQNEMNVYAAIELQRSHLQGDSLMITCAEGLKASVIVDGRILSGDHGNFGAVGHFIVEENGRLCYCGAKGCLQMYVSGHAFREQILAYGKAVDGISDPNDPALADRVFALAAEGNPFCRSLVEQSVPYMAYAFSSLTRMTDIDRVVLLGAFVGGGSYLQDLLQEKIASRLPDVARSRLSLSIGSRADRKDVIAMAAMPAIQQYLGYRDCS